MRRETILTKQNTYTYLSALCLRCAANFTCVSGSTVGMDKTEYLTSQHRLTPETPAMREGKRKHEEAQAGYVELGDIGFERLRTILERGEPLIVKEAPVCTMLRNGYRGKIDLLTIQKKDGEWWVDIFDWKSSWNKKHFLQLATYGTVFGQTTANYLHVTEHKWLPIYDEEPVLNIDAHFQIFGETRVFPDRSVPFMRRNKLNEWWLPWYIQVLRRAKKLRTYHRRGMYLLDVPEIPAPTFFGKTKLLRTTPPALPPRIVRR